MTVTEQESLVGIDSLMGSPAITMLTTSCLWTKLTTIWEVHDDNLVFCYYLQWTQGLVVSSPYKIGLFGSWRIPLCEFLRSACRVGFTVRFLR